MMWKVILYCCLLTEAGRLPMVLAHQADVQLGSSVTLPCLDIKHTDITADLDIQWWTGEHLVTRFQLGKIIQGSRYINRTDLSTKRLRKGDFSLLITHTEYSDSGQYQCVLIKNGQSMTLGEVDLEVKVRRPQRALFIKSGQGVLLSCFGHVDWSGSEAAFVQWKRWTQVVVQWKSGSLFVDPMFEGRVSVLKDRIKHGDISLIFNDTRPDDQGYYVCFFKKNNDIRPAAVINLTVTENMSRITADSGSQIQLPLPNESQVSLSFLPDGGNLTVSVCEVERHLLTCTSHYTNRTLLHNTTLILTNITPPDSGTFIVRDRGTGRTRSVVIIQIFNVGTNKITFGISIIPIVAGVVILVVLSAFSGYCCHKIQKVSRSMERNRKKETEKETEMNLLQPTEVITHEATRSCNESAIIEI
ncbi:uncharacterized protein LOC130560107 [Triplophysa rosa]|uniref:Neogenin-like n=1 Tax=Triplophysa rosa TaxID=992332 RepID=A0A9W7WM24_TRIRA|nr:uncharacterized protein LOC130560107 [Triplophysa rosa]KAI7804540.1 putative neogenin-like [Triplophysa rosa]